MSRDPQLDVEPLRRLLAAWLDRGHSVDELAGISGVPRRTIYRVTDSPQAAVSVWTADALCCAIGSHPFLVWRWAWVAAA